MFQDRSERWGGAILSFRLNWQKSDEDYISE